MPLAELQRELSAKGGQTARFAALLSHLGLISLGAGGPKKRTLLKDKDDKYYK
jgi:hypothetical protein